MKIGIAAIGLLKSGPEKELAAEYEQRIQGAGRQAGITGFQIQDWAESKAATADLRKVEEAKRLWSAGIVWSLISASIFGASAINSPTQRF